MEFGSTPAGGSYPSAQSVTLTANEAATIFYTTDGSAPTTASTAYTGPIAVAASTTLNYIGVDTAGNTSTVATQNYTIGAVVIASSPANPSADTSPTFAFSTPGITGATFACAKTAGAAHRRGLRSVHLTGQLPQSPPTGPGRSRSTPLTPPEHRSARPPARSCSTRAPRC